MPVVWQTLKLALIRPKRRNPPGNEAPSVTPPARDRIRGRLLITRAGDSALCGSDTASGACRTDADASHTSLQPQPIRAIRLTAAVQIAPRTIGRCGRRVAGNAQHQPGRVVHVAVAVVIDVGVARRRYAERI